MNVQAVFEKSGVLLSFPTPDGGSFKPAKLVSSAEQTNCVALLLICTKILTLPAWWNNDSFSQDYLAPNAWKIFGAEERLFPWHAQTERK